MRVQLTVAALIAGNFLMNVIELSGLTLINGSLSAGLVLIAQKCLF